MKTTEESTLKYAMYHSCALLEKKLLEDALSDRGNKILNVSICEGNCIKGLVTNTEPFGIERYPNLVSVVMKVDTNLKIFSKYKICSGWEEERKGKGGWKKRENRQNSFNYINSDREMGREEKLC